MSMAASKLTSGSALTGACTLKSGLPVRKEKKNPCQALLAQDGARWLLGSDCHRPTKVMGLQPEPQADADC